MVRPSAAEAYELSYVARDNISAVSFLVGDVRWNQGCKLIAKAAKVTATPRVNILNDSLGMADKLVNALHVGRVGRVGIALGDAAKLGQPLAEKLHELQTPIQARAEQVQPMLRYGTENSAAEEARQYWNQFWHICLAIVLGFATGFALWPNDPSSATAATRRADCNRDGPPPFAAAHG